MLLTGKWNWEKINKHLHVRFHPAVAAVTCVVHDPEEDKLIWSRTKSVTLTAASTNNLMSNMRWGQREEKWKVVWS